MNFENLPTKIDLPYPEIIDAIDNKDTVRVIKNLATSRESELTASLQYIYQSVVADNILPQVAEELEEIGVVEMHHLDMLMHAIVEFGGDPTYTDSRGNYFSTQSVYYSRNLKQILDTNIDGEYAAIEAYKRASEMVDNASLKELFARIILDEECHIKIFKYIRESIEFLSL